MANSYLSLSLVLAVTVSTPALAQYAPSATATEPRILPRNGQDAQQLSRDRYECYGWAKQQSGFDPAQSGNAPARDLYRRAFKACLEGRGYTVNYPAPAAAAPAPGGAAPLVVPAPPPPPPPPVAYVNPRWAAAPELVYRPFHVAIEGGYSVTAGSTNDALNDGSNVGVGISWFPVSSIPVGLRVDGSWSRFDASHGYIDASGDYFHGHENIYGGDVDLQFNLAHASSRYQFYLLGGAGWYREQTVIDQFEPGCGYYDCGGGYAGDRTSTTSWRSSWNAGVGGETALPGGVSFFIEARYQRIAPHDSDMQFVPIRVGLRF